MKKIKIKIWIKKRTQPTRFYPYFINPSDIHRLLDAGIAVYGPSYQGPKSEAGMEEAKKAYFKKHNIT